MPADLVRSRRFVSTLGLLACLGVGVGSAQHALAQSVIATGQLLRADGVRENRYYRIDAITGVASPISPDLGPGLPAAIAGAGGNRLFSGVNGTLEQIDPTTGVRTFIAANAGISSTGFDIVITPSGQSGFTLSGSGGASGNRQLFRIDLASGLATPVGSPTAVADALEAAFALPVGTARPFIIGLGSVADSIYGVHVESGRTNLITIDPITGAASVIGAPNAVGSSLGGQFSGFSALTGVDLNRDGRFDTLLGNVNFDNTQPSGTVEARAGGLVRYDLTTGQFSLVGTNPGLIFFGFASFPRCVADFNESGNVSVQDIFDYLGAWFASSPAADVNGGFSSAPTVQDIFDFLGAWFAGGC